MKKQIIPFIPGDGIGPEIMACTKKVVDAAVETAYKGDKAIEWLEIPAGEQAYAASGEHLPSTSIETIRKNKIAIKGPLTTPISGGYRSLNVALRQKLDLYVCQRPVRWFRGLPSPHCSPEGIDVVIFRENTEDLYAGIEYKAGSPAHLEFMQAFQTNMGDDFKRIPTPPECGIGIKPISKTNSQRLVRAAIKWAVDHNRKRVTLVHKGNIMKYTEGAFMQWGYDMAEAHFSGSTFTRRTYQKSVKKAGKQQADHEKERALRSGKIWVDDVIADVVFEKLITYPQQFDVIATTNLNGDYISDAAAALAGGVGISPGANINYTHGTALFEANHGSAQEIAGQDKANPSSLILSAAMMLDTMGWDESAKLARKGLEGAIQSKHVTFDLAAQIPGATSVGCETFTHQVVTHIRSEAA